MGRSVADLITVTANFTKSAVKWLTIAMEFANLVRSAVDLIADDVRWLRSVAELITGHQYTLYGTLESLCGNQIISMVIKTLFMALLTDFTATKSSLWSSKHSLRHS